MTNPHDVYPIEFGEQGGECPTGFEQRSCHGADQKWIWGDKIKSEFGRRISDALRDFFHKTREENPRRISLQSSIPEHYLVSWFGKYLNLTQFIYPVESENILNQDIQTWISIM